MRTQTWLVMWMVLACGGEVPSAPDPILPSPQPGVYQVEYIGRGLESLDPSGNRVVVRYVLAPFKANLRTIELISTSKSSRTGRVIIADTLWVERVEPGYVFDPEPLDPYFSVIEGEYSINTQEVLIFTELGYQSTPFTRVKWTEWEGGVLFGTGRRQSKIDGWTITETDTLQLRLIH